VDKKNLKQNIKNLPHAPGTYLFKNKAGRIIYVGKAKDLRNRVGSYFATQLDPLSKTGALVANIASIAHIEAETEFEAIILEAELIKKHRPKYNIDLKDDKTFLYITIQKEQVKAGDTTLKLSKITTKRESDLEKRDKVFGPYADSRPAKQMLRLLRRIFPYRDCSPTKFSRYARLGQPCLYGHIKLCPAPCINKDVTENNNSIKKIERILDGKASALLRDLNAQMKRLSKAQKYENAACVRDVVSKFEYLRQSFKSPHEYIENPLLLEDIAEESLQSLVDVLPFLDSPPLRIECYDISNISGKDAVGGMVVATNGRMDKSQYRRFKVRLKQTPDDFGMMAEVLKRRLKRKDWPKPDLIVLDGGKGQLSAVIKVMNVLRRRYPLVGLAKRQETLVYKVGHQFFERQLREDNKGLHLLIQLRDESHRFAQDYHHKLRERSLYK
jgi:excinuclease ABC subunit C